MAPAPPLPPSPRRAQRPGPGNGAGAGSSLANGRTRSPCPPRALRRRHPRSFTVNHGEPKPLLNGSVLPKSSSSRAPDANPFPLPAIARSSGPPRPASRAPATAGLNLPPSAISGGQRGPPPPTGPHVPSSTATDSTSSRRATNPPTTISEITSLFRSVRPKCTPGQNRRPHPRAQRGVEHHLDGVYTFGEHQQ